ncbi:MAG: L-aspartate oxidase [Gemmatimonadetes bacterium]|nr:L-aspartate oxidase [Gemmatimonadota bacterium]
MPRIEEVDHLVIGSGIAGLSFAIEVARRGGSVRVVTKKEHHESSTNRAQGGIAAVLDPTDSLEAHVHDTIRAGAGLCHEQTVRLMVEEGPVRIAELIALGVGFTKDADRSGLALGIEGGHSHRRIAHAKDLTGAEIERALVAACESNDRIELSDHHVAIDLITGVGGDGWHGCRGALILDSATGEVGVVLARTTMLSTGGCGQVFPRTTNPEIATGDGVAMAFRAGVVIANMEFIQFHPTALAVDSADSFLISEAVRGEGGILKTLDGRAFMHRYDERRELASRDIVARAIDAELKRRGDPHVLLDVTHFAPGRFEDRFPHIHARCAKHGIDIEKGAIPVAPSAHYSCGGVVTDHEGAASMPGLFAAGEVACTGVHGANRLASNSLLEAVVFAHRAAIAASGVEGVDHGAARAGVRTSIEALMARGDPPPFGRVATIRAAVADLMQDYAGIVRTRARLARAADRLAQAASEVHGLAAMSRPSEDLLELRSIVTTGLLIVQSALARPESRGLHWLRERPRPEEVAHDTLLRPDPGGDVAIVERVPSRSRW